MAARKGDRGLDQKIVQIEEIADGVAHCLDRFGRIEAIPVNIQRAKGGLPRVGEQWVVDKAVAGRWSFSAVLNPQPPTVTGSRSANPALAAVLDVLAEAGLIVDETTLGVAPGGGGVTDHGDLTGLGDDDHPQYLREDEADLLYEDLGAAADVIIAHEGDSDPHPQYAQESMLGTAATADMADFATPAQGALADTALQSASNLGDVASVDDAQANLAVPIPYTAPPGYGYIPGGIVTSRYNNAVGSVNRMNFEQWSFDEPTEVHIGMLVGTAGAVGLGFRAYVYAADATGLQPTGSILFDTGLVTTDATGVRESASTYTFARGKYVICWTYNSGSTYTLMTVITKSFGLADTDSVSMYVYTAQGAGGSGSVVTPPAVAPTAVVGVIQNPPRFALRARNA